MQSNSSSERLQSQFASNDSLKISTGDNASAIKAADVIILALDPSAIERGLTQPGIKDALSSKLLISVAAGWTRQKIEETLYGSSTAENENENENGRAFVIRTLPTIPALVGQSLTSIEIEPDRQIPQEHLDLTDAIFSRVGKTVHVPPNLLNPATAVAGSTPAMFAVIVDALVDAAVAVGMPRATATTMIVQSMAGSAAMMQSGMTAAELRDQGTSPEGCTIGGLMVLEENGVRGGVGRALREAVTLARIMDGVRHVNDTRE